MTDSMLACVPNITEFILIVSLIVFFIYVIEIPHPYAGKIPIYYSVGDFYLLWFSVTYVTAVINQNLSEFKKQGIVLIWIALENMFYNRNVCIHHFTLHKIFVTLKENTEIFYPGKVYRMSYSEKNCEQNFLFLNFAKLLQRHRSTPNGWQSIDFLYNKIFTLYTSS